MYTVALLPDKKTQKALAKLTKANMEFLATPPLNMRNNKPHVTLLKTAFKPTTNLNEILEKVSSEVKNQPPSGILQGLKLNYSNLIATFSNDSSIVNMHNILLPHVKPLVDKRGIKNKKFVGLTVEEVESYFKYGYKYTGDKYFSHLTLGRSKNQEIPYEIEKEYEERLLGQEVIFNRIVICRQVKNLLGPVVAYKKLNNKEVLLIS